MANASSFTPELLCSTLVSALRLISPGDEGIAELPGALPGNVAARHKVATALAKCIKGAGFAPGEVGYNQLLYPNEKDVRKLLSWAVGRLPRVESGAGEGGDRGATPAGTLLRGLKAWLQPGGVGAGAAAAAATTTTTTTTLSQSALEGLQRHCGCSSSVSSEGLARARALRESALAALRLAALEGGVEAEAGGSPSAAAGAAASSSGATSGAASASASAAAAAAAAAAQPTPPGGSLWLALADPSALSGLPSFAPPSWEDLLAGAGPRQRHFPGTHLDASPSAFNRRAAFAIVVERRAGGRGARAPAPSPSAAELLSRPKTEEEVARDREEELAAMAARLEAAKAEAEGLSAQAGSLLALLPGLRAALAAAGEALARLERGYAARKAALDMLPEAAAHTARLQGEVKDAREALTALAGEWEAVRAPLAAAVAEEEAAGVAAAARAEALAAELGRMRGEMGEMRAAAAGKEELARKLEAEVGRVAAGGLESRASYQRQVMGAVLGLRKQAAEIARIVGDVRALQLELAAVGEGLKRIAGVALETMERAAQEHIKDSNFREAFKQVLRIQGMYQELVACAAAEGAAVNEARDLENRIDQLMAREEGKALESVARDLEAVRAENAQLAAGKR